MMTLCFLPKFTFLYIPITNISIKTGIFKDSIVTSSTFIYPVQLRAEPCHRLCHIIRSCQENDGANCQDSTVLKC